MIEAHPVGAKRLINNDKGDNMSEALTTFGSAGLPSAAALAAALRNVPNEAGAVGVAILKCDKTGCWVFGTESTEVEEGSKWAINPFSFIHGNIAWGDGEVLAETMRPITEPLPELGPAPAGAEKGWESQLGFMLKCLTGEDEGLEARYAATSVGGKRAIQEIAAKIATQVDADPTHPVPVVELLSEHYQHKKYGKIYSPKLKLVEWVGMDGLKDAEEDPKEIEAAPEVAPEPERRRRRA
jgi:hypothetical protein